MKYFWDKSPNIIIVCSMEYLTVSFFAAQFNPSTGVLTISGAATAAVYSATLEQIYYFNG